MIAKYQFVLELDCEKHSIKEQKITYYNISIIKFH